MRALTVVLDPGPKGNQKQPNPDGEKRHSEVKDKPSASANSFRVHGAAVFAISFYGHKNFGWDVSVFLREDNGEVAVPLLDKINAANCRKV